MPASAVVELRRYHLVPGGRETLIDVFEREFLESQEALGMQILGQFRERDDPDRFTWMRGFPDMGRRRAALAAFYGGPVWAAHRDVANPTMISSDDVLLLRPVAASTALDAPPSREPVGSRAAHDAVYRVSTYSLREPIDDATRAGLVELVSHDARTPGLLETLRAENTFPALPVREGETVLVHVERGTDGGGGDMAGPLMTSLEQVAGGPPLTLVLSPTSRSRLR